MTTKKHDFKSSVQKGLQNQVQSEKLATSRPSLAEMASRIGSEEERPAKREAQPKSKPKPERKQQPVKDAFSCTTEDLTKLRKLIDRSKVLGIRAKKSEVIRAGILFLTEATDTKFKELMMSVPEIKTGRPATKAKIISNDTE